MTYDMTNKETAWLGVLAHTGSEGDGVEHYDEGM